MKKLLCFLSAFASPALGQDAPVYDFFNVSQGTVYVWDSDSGIATGTLIQRDGDLQKIHIVFGAGDQAEQDIWVTSQSRLTRASRADGVISFYPNDCSRTVGQCRTRISTSFGHSVGMTAQGSFADGIWIYVNQFDTNGFESFAQKECVIYDENGVLLASTSISFDGAIEWQRRISDGYEGSSKTLLSQVRAACQIDQHVS